MSGFIIIYKTICVPVCRHLFQSLSILFFQTGSLTEGGARMRGGQTPGILLYMLPYCLDYRHTKLRKLFTMGPGNEFINTSLTERSSLVPFFFLFYVGPGFESSASLHTRSSLHHQTTQHALLAFLKTVLSECEQVCVEKA